MPFISFSSKHVHGGARRECQQTTEEVQEAVDGGIRRTDHLVFVLDHWLSNRSQENPFNGKLHSAINQSFTPFPV